MIIELPGIEFESHKKNSATVERVLGKVQEFLERKAINRDEYGLGEEPTLGYGELIIKMINDYWLVFTTERGSNFDVAVFSDGFYAVNYFIFRLTGDKETIDWTTD